MYSLGVSVCVPGCWRYKSTQNNTKSREHTGGRLFGANVGMGNPTNAKNAGCTAGVIPVRGVTSLMVKLEVHALGPTV